MANPRPDEKVHPILNEGVGLSSYELKGSGALRWKLTTTNGPHRVVLTMETHDVRRLLQDLSWAVNR